MAKMTGSNPVDSGSNPAAPANYIWTVQDDGRVVFIATQKALVTDWVYQNRKKYMVLICDCWKRRKGVEYEKMPLV